MPSSFCPHFCDKNPTSEPALTMLASQYAQTNRMPEAIALVEKAHKAEPANTRLTASLGDLYIRSGKPARHLTGQQGQDVPAATSIC